MELAKTTVAEANNYTVQWKRPVEM